MIKEDFSATVIPSRPKPPAIELEDVVDIQSMSPKDLVLVPFEERFWFCGVDNCCSKSMVKDYGIVNTSGSIPVTHVFYWPRRNEWVDIFKVFRICGKHWKMYRQFWKDQTGPQPKSINKMWPVTKEEVPGNDPFYNTCSKYSRIIFYF